MGRLLKCLVLGATKAAAAAAAAAGDSGEIPRATRQRWEEIYEPKEKRYLFKLERSEKVERESKSCSSW